MSNLRGFHRDMRYEGSKNPHYSYFRSNSASAEFGVSERIMRSAHREPFVKRLLGLLRLNIRAGTTFPPLSTLPSFELDVGSFLSASASQEAKLLGPQKALLSAGLFGKERVALGLLRFERRSLAPKARRIPSYPMVPWRCFYN